MLDYIEAVFSPLHLVLDSFSFIFLPLFFSLSLSTDLA